MQSMLNRGLPTTHRGAPTAMMQAEAYLLHMCMNHGLLGFAPASGSHRRFSLLPFFCPSPATPCANVWWLHDYGTVGRCAAMKCSAKNHNQTWFSSVWIANVRTFCTHENTAGKPEVGTVSRRKKKPGGESTWYRDGLPLCHFSSFLSLRARRANETNYVSFLCKAKRTPSRHGVHPNLTHSY